MQSNESCQRLNVYMQWPALIIYYSGLDNVIILCIGLLLDKRIWDSPSLQIMKCKETI